MTQRSTGLLIIISSDPLTVILVEFIGNVKNTTVDIKYQQKRTSKEQDDASKAVLLV